MGIFPQIFLQPPRQPLAQSTFLGKESVGMFNAAQSSFSPFNEDLMRFVVIPQFLKMYTMCEVRESVQSTCAEANFNVQQAALLFIRLASEWEHITDRWLLCYANREQRKAEEIYVNSSNRNISLRTFPNKL